MNSLASSSTIDPTEQVATFCGGVVWGAQGVWLWQRVSELGERQVQVEMIRLPNQPHQRKAWLERL